jgi:cadmium resistance protein CadD (predicted permease)
VSVELVGQAATLFAGTNIDDIVLLAVLFGRATGPARPLQIVIGWYAGYVVVLAAAVVGALGARLLPESVIPFLGLLPLVLGVRAAWTAWRERCSRDGSLSGDAALYSASTPGAGTSAALSLGNGGDNIGVYVPVFAASRPGAQLIYVVVFLVLVAVWCAAGRLLASRPLVARAMTRWGHVVLPVVLIGVGLAILIEGKAFGL